MVALGDGVPGQGAEVELHVTLQVAQAGPVGIETRAGVLHKGERGTVSLHKQGCVSIAYKP